MLCLTSAGVGRKGLYVYNLPEVQSARKYLRVRGASARFGTDPFVWNWVMWLIARLVPAPLLRDRGFARGLARLAEPFVRLTDVLTGETVVGGLQGGHVRVGERYPPRVACVGGCVGPRAGVSGCE